MAAASLSVLVSGRTRCLELELAVLVVRSLVLCVTDSIAQMPAQFNTTMSIERDIRIRAGGISLRGELKIPEGAKGIVIFAHGSRSSRHSPRNQYVAQVLRDSQLGTLLFDLLTREEEIAGLYAHHLRFNIRLLAERLMLASVWVLNSHAGKIQIGFFGVGTGGGAALRAAAELGDAVSAVVSRSGRPDFAEEGLGRVTSPTLLIIGQRDTAVIELNREAYSRLPCEKQMQIVPGASHLFEEPGTLDEVAHLAAAWFAQHLFTAYEETVYG